MNPSPILDVPITPDTRISWLSPPEPRSADSRPPLRVPSIEIAPQLRDLLPRQS